jgi:hypothetical protein
MKIIKSPWKDLFFELVDATTESIQITSPYLKEKIVNEIVDRKKNDVAISLVTSFKLMNYHVGASDLNALELILNDKGVVKNYQKVHSKIYIFDSKYAVITSGNLTNGGLINNYEYGVLIDDTKEIEIINSDYVALTNHDSTGNITLSEIKQAKTILSKVPLNKPIFIPNTDIVNDSYQTDIFTGGVESIATSLSGWKLSVFNYLIRLQKTEFKLSDLNQFIPALSVEYPNNNNIEAKIRQQLQELRDLGLIEFVSKGEYKKLWV